MFIIKLGWSRSVVIQLTTSFFSIGFDLHSSGESGVFLACTDRVKNEVEEDPGSQVLEGGVQAHDVAVLKVSTVGLRVQELCKMIDAFVTLYSADRVDDNFSQSDSKLGLGLALLGGGVRFDPGHHGGGLDGGSGGELIGFGRLCWEDGGYALSVIGRLTTLLLLGTDGSCGITIGGEFGYTLSRERKVTTNFYCIAREMVVLARTGGSTFKA